MRSDSPPRAAPRDRKKPAMHSLVSLLKRLEVALCIRIPWVLVRVHLEREHQVRLLDLARAGQAVHLEKRVEVHLGALPGRGSRRARSRRARSRRARSRRARSRRARSRRASRLGHGCRRASRRHRACARRRRATARCRRLPARASRWHSGTQRAQSFLPLGRLGRLASPPLSGRRCAAARTGPAARTPGEAGSGPGSHNAFALIGPGSTAAGKVTATASSVIEICSSFSRLNVESRY